MDQLTYFNYNVMNTHQRVLLYRHYSRWVERGRWPPSYVYQRGDREHQMQSAIKKTIFQTIIFYFNKNKIKQVKQPPNFETSKD